MNGWRVERAAGSASRLHAHDVGFDVGRMVRVLEVDRGALVLGSTQPADVVDRDAASALGVEVVRRRSGGGAVLLDPGDTVWVEVLLPSGDRLWDDDVSRSFHWLGDVWVAALAELGVDARAHRGPVVASPLGRLVCFGGLGAGEVLVGDAKAVGMAQRRTRAGARFQVAVPLSWRADRYVEVLAPGLAALHVRSLEGVHVHALGKDGGVSADDVIAALLAHLPR